MLGLDQYGGFLISALIVTAVVFAGYLLYLRSRLTALRRRGASSALDDSQSARNVSAAAPMQTTAHAASSANGPSAS